MRVRRLLAAVITAGLVAPTAALVSTASPASAATATRIVPSEGRSLLNPYSKPIVFGDSMSTSINVVDANGEDVYVGSITVQRLIAGQSTWTTVASNTSAYLYESLKAAGNATYRILYSGGTDGSGESFAAASAAVTIKVQRDLDYSEVPGRKTGIKGKMKPGGKTKIIVQKKVGKKYKKFKTLKTAKSGKFTVVLPAPRRGKWFWKITFTGSKQFQKSVVKGHTYSY